MKKTLSVYFGALRGAYYNYTYFTPDGGHTFEQKEVTDILRDKYDNLVDKYCEFIDVYSIYCDNIIENSNDEILISQSMLFYYMMNKEYFDSKCELDDIKNVKHILDQLEPHKEILDYEFFLKREDELVICELCGGEGDIPDCVLCGKPADYDESKDLKVKRAKYKFNNTDFNGPYFEDRDIKYMDEIYCNKCDKYFSSEIFKDHCKKVHGGYIMVDTERNREMQLKSDIIHQCECQGCDEDEINYVLDHYDYPFFNVKYMNKILNEYTKESFYSDSDESYSTDDHLTSDSEYDSVISEESDKYSTKCNLSNSNNVSEDEIIN